VNSVAAEEKTVPVPLVAFVKHVQAVANKSLLINHIWILKNSKDLFDNLNSRFFSQVSSIKTLDFSTLYTTLPHDKLKTRLKETIHKAFSRPAETVSLQRRQTCYR
jgi:hypothetical protein